MAHQPLAASSPPGLSVSRIAWWVLVLVSFALLLFLIGSEIVRFSTPAELHRLQIAQDIPLPDALPDPRRCRLFLARCFQWPSIPILCV